VARLAKKGIGSSKWPEIACFEIKLLGGIVCKLLKKQVNRCNLKSIMTKAWFINLKIEVCTV